MKISIIVPIYNVETYLERCINSLINQTYKNIEIILVNDGSTDNSLSICKKYSKNDKRIKIIDKKNGGLSDARNAGVKIATGKYVLFVDSDDEIDTNACMELSTIIKKYKADLISFNAITYNENNEIMKNKGYYSDSDSGKIIELSYTEAMIDNMYRKRIKYSAWSKLYSCELAKKIKFPVGMYAEDFATFYIFLKDANKIVHYEKCLYKYYLRENSIMGKKSCKLFYDVYKIETKYNKIMESICKNDVQIKYNASRHLRSLLYSYIMMYNGKDKESFKNEIITIENEINNISFNQVNTREKIVKATFLISKKLTVFLLKNYQKIK